MRAKVCGRALSAVVMAALGTVAVVWGPDGRGDHIQPRERLIAQASSLEHGTATLDRALETAATGGGDRKYRVIVTARSGHAQDAAFAVTSQGGRIFDRFDTIGAVTTVVPADQLSTLAADPRVRSLSSDGVIETAQTRFATASGDRQGELIGENHLLNTLGLGDVRWPGKNVRVAVIDSGVGVVREHRFAGQWNFRRGRNPSFEDADAPKDGYGHGTHVAGLIAAGSGSNDGLYRGVAPRIELFSLQVLNRDGVGRTSDVIRAIEWVLGNARHAKIDIINLSLGQPILEPAETDPLVQVVEAAVRAGIVVVVSAGNHGYRRDTGETGYAGITSPGNAPSAITVGAIDTRLTDGRRDDVVARYSSRGPTWYDGYAKPDLVAPGSALVSPSSDRSRILSENPHLEVDLTAFGNDRYMSLSGTSMAAAVTTGVVARMIHAQAASQGGRLTPNAIKALLQYTALDLDEDVLTQGAGGLNGHGAVTLASVVDGRARTGQWWLTQGVTETSPIAGDTLVWNQRLVWGDRLVWGNHEVYTNEKAWRLRTVWGDRLVWGDRIIWGNADDSVVWGDRLVWGSRLVWGNDAVGFDDGTGIVYGDRIVWGNVTADRLVWGNLDDGTAGTMSVR